MENLYVYFFISDNRVFLDIDFEERTEDYEGHTDLLPSSRSSRKNMETGVLYHFADGQFTYDGKKLVKYVPSEQGEA